jgi:hypothetical protein
MLLEPNAHADHKTQMAHYKTLARFLASEGWDTTLAPQSNGWELSVRNPSDREVKMHPRDLLEATRILSAIVEISSQLANSPNRHKVEVYTMPDPRLR